MSRVSHRISNDAAMRFPLKIEVVDANMAMERSFDAMMAADASGTQGRLKISEKKIETRYMLHLENLHTMDQYARYIYISWG